MSKKPLLNEATVRRFMKLANFNQNTAEHFLGDSDLEEGKDLTKLGGNKEKGAKQHSDHKLKKAKGGGLSSKGNVTEVFDELEEEAPLGDEEPGLGAEGELDAELPVDDVPVDDVPVEGGGDEDVLRRVVRAVAAELGVDVEIEGEEGEGEELPPEEGVEGLEGVEAAPEVPEEPAPLEEEEDDETGIPGSVVNEVARRVAKRLLGN